MSTMECAFCGDEGTPWSEIKGLLCYECHCTSNMLKNRTLSIDHCNDDILPESKL